MHGDKSHSQNQESQFDKPHIYDLYYSTEHSVYKYVCVIGSNILRHKYLGQIHSSKHVQLHVGVGWLHAFFLLSLLI